ncbi:hypothetical protein FOB22_003517 [Saccharomyces cerevisiae]|nr:hypothetical protein FOB22_003517 [Saccharomyces cerevisiae]
MTAALKNKVAVAIDELTVPLMWMIHFAVGYPYRYPELQLLAFAGPQRNVYVDDTTRRIQLYTDYNKNGSSEPRLKTLDGLTSDYRWIQWLGLESDYHCSFSSTRNAEDVVAGEAASSNHHQKISRVTRKRPREPKSTNDILVAGQKLFGSSFEFRDLHQLRLCYEIYMADTPSVAVQAPPGYGKTELFHLPLIALASKGDVKYVSFLFVPYTVLLANCMIRLGRCGCLNVAPVRNFIEEGCDGVTDLYVGIYDDLASTNFTDRIAAWENIVECTFRTNNVKFGLPHSIFLSGTAPEAVADAALQRIGLTGLAKKSMDINELKRSEDLSRGLSSYPTRMFNLIKEKSEVPLGHVHKIRKKVESQPEEALKLLLALFESEPESKAIVVASTTNEVEELACSWRKYFRVVWIHGKLGAAEKVSRTKEFVTDAHSRCRETKRWGLCYLLSRKNSWAARNRKGELPPIKEGCITEQVREFYGLESKKGKKGQHVGCCGSRTDLSADTVELIERMDRLAEKQATASMSIVALPSSFQESNSSDRCRKYCSSDEDSDTCIHGSANASTNATTNSSTNATTTASINVRTSATTTESTDSNTSATTTASTNSSTNATTTESTNSNTSATTTESTDSNTSATTTESTDSNTNATTTASINVRTSATTTESTDSNTSATTTASTNSSTNATTTESTNSNTSATTTESTDSNTSATTTESTDSNTSATTTESTNSSTSATTTASINVRTSATTTKSINSSTNATTTESTNSNTNATTTESTNSNTNATTTESTNSSTNATTTESTNSNTSATTTESTDSNTSATTTASTNSSTNATTTASTNSSTNATTTESTNASAKEDANKDGNAEDNRFHPVTDINKESYKRKGSQMVLLERKKLKAQFPNTSENMNVLQFLGFRSDEIKHLFLYGIDVYFCPEGVFTQYGLCKGCQKMFELCVCWAGQKVSYRRIAWEALAVERMLRNDEEYKEYLEDIEPYHGDPVGYLKYFSVKRREIYSQIQRNYAWYLAITRRRETISVLDSTRGKQGSQVFRMSGRQIKELYYKVWSNLRESKTEVLQYFLNWDEKKCREEWEAKDDTVVVEALEKLEVFQRLRSMTSAGLQGPQYVKLQFGRHHQQLRSRYELSLGMHLRDQLALGVTPSKLPHWTPFLSMLIGLFYNKIFRQKLEYLLEQISEVWLLPHWLDLANVEVLAADNTRVPLYMLMVAVHKELGSDDVPDGKIDIISRRGSSREVGE